MQELISRFNALNDAWVTQAFIIIFIALFFDFLQKRILTRIHKKLEKTSNLWDDSCSHSLRRPLSGLIWLICITFAAQIGAKETDAAIFLAIAPIRYICVIAILYWFLIRLIKGS